MTTQQQLPRSFLDSLALPTKTSTHALYSALQSNYREQGRIGYLRQLKIEKYHCLKTHCYPIFRQKNLIPLPVPLEELERCENTCSSRLKEFNNYFKKSYAQVAYKVDIQKQNKKEALKVAVEDIDSYAKDLVEEELSP
ncbi:unnamed protein product [Moneuplotes crassus]|uniref:Uncharacterized protein n=1 Tax=Euplotes crassus TaxID=5936 RepID=A0AAD1Y4I2_EUPCR|nr:unnamed protein product [Moneuplotes crassus]